MSPTSSTPDTSVSAKRLAANRANAARSTGPRTPEGKARSSRNAVKHGFSGSAFVTCRLEDAHAIDQLKEDAVAFYQPQNSQELVAIERLVTVQQALFRACAYEAGIFTQAINESFDSRDIPLPLMREGLAGFGEIEITRRQNRNFLVAEGMRRLGERAPGAHPLQLAMRYHAQIERFHRRAIDELERVYKLRERFCPNEPNPSAETGESGEPEPLPDNNIPDTYEQVAESWPEQTHADMLYFRPDPDAPYFIIDDESNPPEPIHPNEPNPPVTPVPTTTAEPEKKSPNEPNPPLPPQPAAPETALRNEPDSAPKTAPATPPQTLITG